MKKIIIVLALLVALIPAAAFADFQIGVVAVDPYVSLGGFINGDNLSGSDLAYGLESRLKLWIFQGAISAFYFPSVETLYAYTDVGLALDLLFVRVGAGIGPNLAFDTQGGGSTTLGWNLKTTLDINIGNLGFGVILLTPMDYLSDIRYVLSNYADSTYLGITVMFKLF